MADRAVGGKGRSLLQAGPQPTNQTVSAAESLVKFICIIWFNIYEANLIFWAVSMADSWEACNYGITRMRGSH